MFSDQVTEPPETQVNITEYTWNTSMLSSLQASYFIRKDVALLKPIKDFIVEAATQEQNQWIYKI